MGESEIINCPVCGYEYELYYTDEIVVHQTDCGCKRPSGKINFQYIKSYLINAGVIKNEEPLPKN